METNLRPLTLGEILDRTAQLYRTNFVLFAGIFAIYAAVLLVLNLVQVGLAAWLKAAHLASKLLWVIWTVAGLEWLVVVLLLGAAIAAISRAVAQVHLGEPATIRGAYKSTLPKLGRYLWLMMRTGVVAWGPIGLMYAGLLWAMYHYRAGLETHAGIAATPAQQQALVAIGIAAIVFALLCIPVGIYTIWMNIRYSLAVPAAVVEDVTASAAIKRSIALSKGARWRIFALLMLVVVIKIGLVGLTQSFVFVAAFKSKGQVSMTVNVVSQVIQFFTNSFLGPIGAAGLTLFYFDQRVRKEGYDIEWMMQAAGLVQLTSLISTGEAATADGSDRPQAPVEAEAVESLIDTGSVHE